MNIEIKFLNKNVVNDLPEYQTVGSAAFDLKACINDDICLLPGECKLVGTGVAINIGDPGYAGFILPRSGMGHNKGLVLGNGTGLIDSDYQGELKVSCFNRSEKSIEIKPLMRFAQLVVVPVVKVNFNVVDEFSKDTLRSSGSFGHTGV